MFVTVFSFIDSISNLLCFVSDSKIFRLLNIKVNLESIHSFLWKIHCRRFALCVMYEVSSDIDFTLFSVRDDPYPSETKIFLSGMIEYTQES